MEENATAKMRTETENGKGVHLDEAALQRMEELQREMEKEISLRNGAELTLKAYLKKIQEEQGIADQEDRDQIESCQHQIGEARQRIRVLNRQIEAIMAGKHAEDAEARRDERRREVEYHLSVDECMLQGYSRMLDQVKMSRSEKKELQDQIKMSTMRKAVLAEILGYKYPHTMYMTDAQQNKYDPNTLRFLTGQLSLRIVGIDVPWYPAKENLDDVLKNPKTELQIAVRLDNKEVGRTKKIHNVVPAYYNETIQLDLKRARLLVFDLIVKDKSTGSETIRRMAFCPIESLVESTKGDHCIAFEPCGKLIIEARFTSAGMYGQLQRGQMNMRKRVQNKRLLGHNFKAAPFVKLMKCAVCQTNIGQLAGGYGYQCEQCQLACHLHCCQSEVMTSSCTQTRPGMAAKVEEELSKTTRINHDIPHRFEAYRGIGSAYCMHCGSMVFALHGQGYKCSDCTQVCHKKCRDMIPNTCGLPTSLIIAIKLQKYGSDSEMRIGGGAGAADMTSFGGQFDKLSLKDAPSTMRVIESKSATSVKSARAATAQVVTDGVKFSLASFHLHAVLGRGNFGKVFLAEGKKDKRLYAIKCIKKHYTIVQEEVESIMIEKRIFQVVTGNRHPFLVNLYGCFQTAADLCFVMEFACGGDLMMHIHNSKKFDEDRARFYASEIVLGFEFLHKNGIIYRDLKLDNLLLDAEGHIKIADFGLCKDNIFDGDRTSTFCGTPEFIAPEILQEDSYTRAVDWWALGVLVFEMLLGMAPFYGNTEDEIFEQILYSRISLKGQRITPEARNIIAALMERVPEKRLGYGPGDAEDVKAHEFFAGVNWDDVYHKRIRPPYVPVLSSAKDVSNFDREFTSEKPCLTPPCGSPLSEAEQAAFQNFSFSAAWLDTSKV